MIAIMLQGAISRGYGQTSQLSAFCAVTAFGAICQLFKRLSCMHVELAVLWSQICFWHSGRNFSALYSSIVEWFEFGTVMK